MTAVKAHIGPKKISIKEREARTIVALKEAMAHIQGLERAILAVAGQNDVVEAQANLRGLAQLIRQAQADRLKLLSGQNPGQTPATETIQ